MRGIDVEHRTRETEDPCLGGDAAATVPVPGSTTMRPANPPDTRGWNNADRLLHAFEARLTCGISPAAVWAAGMDWLVHLLNAPGKRLALGEMAIRDAAASVHYGGRRAMGLEAEPPVAMPAADGRFSDPDWHDLPFALAAQAFLLAERWWQAATTELARRHGPARASDRLHGPSVARRVLARQLPLEQSRGRAKDARRSGHELSHAASATGWTISGHC